MNIARLSDLKPVLVSLALTFTFIAQLHGQGWNPPFKQKYDEHEFLAACRQNRADIAEHWLKKKDFDPDGKYLCGDSGRKTRGLMVAAINGQPDTTRVLLDYGANPNAPTSCTPLVQASARGHTETVRVLLDKNSDPNLAQTCDGLNPLVAAIIMRNPDIADMLLENGANPNITSNHYAPPLYAAAFHGQMYMVKRLLSYGADPNHIADNGLCPLYIACRRRKTYVAKVLIDGGADVNWISNNGCTALYLAAQNGYEIMTKLLLEKGADTSLGEQHYLCFKDTPLRAAKRERLLSRLHNRRKYESYTKIIDLLSEHELIVPTPAQQHPEPESTYGTPAQSVVDEDISSEGVVALGASLQQVTFQKDVPK